MYCLVINVVSLTTIILVCNKFVIKIVVLTTSSSSFLFFFFFFFFFFLYIYIVLLLCFGLKERKKKKKMVEGLILVCKEISLLHACENT
jgi:drug/metabolite transporter (DMT)-like permease